jgi:thiosulfate dehydrogenase [quinone] large subunit
MAQQLKAFPVTMDHPAQWLAVLRMVVGLYFVKSLITKMSLILLGGIFPFPAVSERWLAVMPKIVAKQASENPVLFYKQFLEGTVLPHSSTFAQMTAWGETVVGIGLTLGLVTGVASLVGLLLVINYGLATQWMSSALLPDAGIFLCPGGTVLGCRPVARGTMAEVVSEPAAVFLTAV